MQFVFLHYDIFQFPSVNIQLGGGHEMFAGLKQGVSVRPIMAHMDDGAKDA